MLYLLALTFRFFSFPNPVWEREEAGEAFLTSPHFNSKFQAVTPVPSNNNPGEKGGEVHKIYQISAFKVNG